MMRDQEFSSNEPTSSMPNIKRDPSSAIAGVRRSSYKNNVIASDTMYAGVQKELA